MLVEAKDKDILFPHLKGINIRQKMVVNYIGSLTLAELLAQKIFLNVKRLIRDGTEMIVIKDSLEMSILDEGRTALVEFISTKKNDIIADQFCYLL